MIGKNVAIRDLAVAGFVPNIAAARARTGIGENMLTTTKWVLISFGCVAAGCSDSEVGFRNSVPAVGITNPADGHVMSFGEAIQFEGSVQDKQDDANALQVVWESSIDGVLDDDPADSSGYLMFNTSLLSGGEHVLSLIHI